MNILSYTRENGLFRMQIDQEFRNIKYVRLDIPGGGTRYYPVKVVSSKWLELEDDPGFTLDDQGKLKFFTFPHEEFSGRVLYTVFETSK